MSAEEKEASLEKLSQWRQANPERVKEQRKRSGEKRKGSESVKAYSKLAYERKKQWKKDHPEEAALKRSKINGRRIVDRDNKKKKITTSYCGEEILCEHCNIHHTGNEFFYAGVIRKVLWCNRCRKDFPVEYKNEKYKRWRQDNSEKVAEEYKRHNARRTEKIKQGEPSAEYYTRGRKATEILGVAFETVRTWYHDGILHGIIWRKKLFIENTSMQAHAQVLQQAREQEQNKLQKETEERHFKSTHLSITQAAQLLGMSKQRLSQHYLAGRISGAKIGSTVFVNTDVVKEELEAYRKGISRGPKPRTL